MSSRFVQVRVYPEVSIRSTPRPHPIPSPAARLRMLRLSVTDLCNFRCRYCMPLEGVPNKLRREDVLPLEELGRMVSWLTIHAGIEKVRLTGGEPLIRPGIEHLIAQLSSTPGIREVALTTNASLLPQRAWSLKAAGLSRVNISLDSMDEKRFGEVTRGGRFQRTMAGIRAAKEAGLTPIKLNSVLQRSTYKEEIPRLLDFAAEEGFEIRFIELMRTGTEKAWCESEYISVDEVKASMGDDFVPVADQDFTPAQRTQLNWKGQRMTVGWITPRSHPFCNRCERLRMDAKGNLRRCLMDGTTLDLHNLLKTGDEMAAFAEFYSYVAGKMPPRTMESMIAMCQIGG